MIAAFLILPRYWDFLIFFNKGEKKNYHSRFDERDNE